jgi:hypothetical protein
MANLEIPPGVGPERWPFATAFASRVGPILHDAAIEFLIDTIDKAPDALVHFTRGDAARSIIGSGELWVQPLSKQDDKLEGKLLRSRAAELYKPHDAALPRRTPSGDWDIDDTDQERFWLLARYNAFKTEMPPAQPYITCFADGVGGPRHWLEHADKKRGCALVFEHSALENAVMECAGKLGHGARLVPVLYRESQHRGLIDRMVAVLRHHWTPAFSDAPSILERHAMAGAASAALDVAFWHLGAFIKRERFAWEREWRVIIDVRAPVGAPAPDKVKLRCVDAGLRHWFCGEHRTERERREDEAQVQRHTPAVDISGFMMPARSSRRRR